MSSVDAGDRAAGGGDDAVTFLIDCPNCGPREALEFSYGGETTSRGTGTRPSGSSPTTCSIAGT